MLVRTRVGPLAIADVIEVTTWEPPSRMSVAHVGRVRGSGDFVLEETPTGTNMRWTERLSFPWFLGGGLSAALARPVLRRIFQADLDRFAALVERSGR